MTNKLQQWEKPIAVFTPEAEQFYDTLEENTGSRQLTPQAMRRWRFPGAGGSRWLHEDAETGEREEAEEITGIVIQQRPMRSFYRTSYDGGGQPPDCSSADGITGTPYADEDGLVINEIVTEDGEIWRYGGECAKCPLSQWGSKIAIGNGNSANAQACSEYRELIVQRPDSILPEIVRLPPSALSNWFKVGQKFAASGRAFSRTVISLELKIAPKQTTANLIVRPLGWLPAEVGNQLRALAPKKQALIAEASEIDPEPDYIPDPDQAFNDELAGVPPF